jgi:hypothetical protein
VLALLTTLLDIIRLKKGPDAMPYSWIITLITLMLWLVAGFVITATSEEMTDEDFLIGTFTGVAGLGCYASIVVLSGHTPRLLQTVTAILGCGAVLSFVFVAGTLVLTPLLGVGTANLVVTLVLLWSIPVEGHIIARAIDRHWYVGIVAAMAVFVFQLFLYGLLNPAVETVA